jgi:carboxymethylenebutenolidase
MTGLDWPGAAADLKGAAAFLKSHGYSQVFVTGYCMGGALSLATSVLNGDNLKGN